MKPSFSVLTVSKRTGWEIDAIRCMEQQTIKPYEWIIVSECLGEVIGGFTTSNYAIVAIPAPEQIRASNLNASLNEGLQHISTDYVIFYQDFIDLPKDCFEKLISLATPETFVTTCTPNYDGTDDARYTGLDTPRTCRPEEWEANVAIAPMSVLRELGGFEEELDNGWAWDNVNVAERAAMLGCNFIIDESNRPKLLPHELTSKLELELNEERHTRIMKEIRDGIRPLKTNKNERRTKIS